jgi:hypothetical protein
MIECHPEDSSETADKTDVRIQCPERFLFGHHFISTMLHRPHPKVKFTQSEDERLRELVSELGDLSRLNPGAVPLAIDHEFMHWFQSVQVPAPMVRFDAPRHTEAGPRLNSPTSGNDGKTCGRFTEEREENRVNFRLVLHLEQAHVICKTAAFWALANLEYQYVCSVHTLRLTQRGLVGVSHAKGMVS